MSWTYPGGFDATTLAANARLGTLYNNTAYDPSTNPGGFRPGSAGAGHLVNFIPALGDAYLAALGASDAATAAGASAAAAAVSDTSAAASAAKLSGTSATSVAIGTGSKSFTTQASKFFAVGTWLNIRSAANPTLNYMIGQSTSYSGAALSANVTVVGGSGTFTDWIIEISAAPGQAGATGATGLRGPSPAIQWTFSDGTTDSDPGNGLFKLNSATLAAVGFIYFDNINVDSIDVTAWLDALDDSTNTADRGRIYLQKYTSPDKYITFKVTGAIVDGTSYRKVPVALISASAASVPFVAADLVSIDFSPTGNKGADGAGAGDVIGPASAIDGAIVLFDTTTGKLVKDSAKGIGTSGANVGLLNTNNTHSGTMSFTGAVAWSSTLIGTVANANALTVGANGSTNPALNINTATASCVTGLSIVAAAATAGLALAVTSSGTDENLTVNAKGAGSIIFNTAATGALKFARDAVPNASDGAALGSGSLMWSDLFLASGGVINFNNGNATITHSAGLLTANAAIKTTDTTASTSTTTGSGIFGGGIGVAGKAFFGDVVVIPVGAVGAPSLYFSGVTDTGLYQSASGEIGFTANGVLRLSISGGTGGPVGNSSLFMPYSAGYPFTTRTTATSGVVGIMQFFDGADTSLGAILGDTTANSVSYNTTSDGDLKIDDGELDNSGGVIDQLRPIRFRWKENPGATPRPGLVAQEVYEVVPEAVTPPIPGITEFWQMDQSKLMPYVIAELKKLRRRTHQLETERRG